MKSPLSFLLATIIFVLGVFSLGFIASIIISHRIEAVQRDAVLVETKQAALLTSSQDIASLSASFSDLSNPVYQQLKTKLVHFREADPNIRYVYLMGYHPELHAQFSYVDSEPTTSADYAPPGQAYTAKQEDINHYLAGEPYIDGPFQDSSGEWVSGYAPIRGEQGNVIAMIGVDIATTASQSQIGFVHVVIGIIAMLLSIIVLVISLSFYRKLASDTLASKQSKRTGKQSVLEHMQQLAQVGTFTIDFPDESITVDEQFLPLFRDTHLEKDIFRTFIHLDDQERYEAMLKDITTSNIVYAWVDIRIGTTEAGFRKYHIYGNIERHASGPAERFDGAIQDITDTK